MFTILLGDRAFCQKQGSMKIQEITVAPTPVTASLHAIFPNATIRSVDTTMSNGVIGYKIEIMDGVQKRIAIFSSEGVIEAVVDCITIAALPERVQKAVSRNFPLANIVEAYKKTASDGYEYSVRVAEKKDTTQLNFTATTMTISSKGSPEKLRAAKNARLARY